MARAQEFWALEVDGVKIVKPEEFKMHNVCIDLINKEAMRKSECVFVATVVSRTKAQLRSRIGVNNVMQEAHKTPEEIEEEVNRAFELLAKHHPQLQMAQDTLRDNIKRHIEARDGESYLEDYIPMQLTDAQEEEVDEILRLQLNAPPVEVKANAIEVDQSPTQELERKERQLNLLERKPETFDEFMDKCLEKKKALGIYEECHDDEKSGSLVIETEDDVADA